MDIGDKETVAIYIQASVTCYLHVIHRYTRMVRTIRVWSYRTRMVYKIVPYAYSTYHTCMVCTIRVRYKIRVWYRTWPLGGTNEVTWCIKLLPTTVSAYQVDCGYFCALLRTHCCCLSPCGWYDPPSAPHPPTSYKLHP